jgi:hypothetical protein
MNQHDEPIPLTYASADGGDARRPIATRHVLFAALLTILAVQSVYEGPPQLSFRYLSNSYDDWIDPPGWPRHVYDLSLLAVALISPWFAHPWIWPISNAAGVGALLAFWDAMMSRGCYQADSLIECAMESGWFFLFWFARAAHAGWVSHRWGFGGRGLMGTSMFAPPSPSQPQDGPPDADG